MAQLSVAVRNAQASQLEAIIGASAKLYLYSAAKPANITDADPSAALCVIDLPADWLTVAASGAVTKNGTWSGVGAAAAGTGTAAVSFRIKDSTGTTTHLQGTAGGAASGQECLLDNASIAQNQAVTVSAFTWTQGNA